MTLQIQWNTLTLPAWEGYFQQIQQSNMLQSYGYARAMTQKQGQTARWGFMTWDGQPAGLVQIFEASLFYKAIHAVIIDRGPIWIDGFGTDTHQQAFWQEINRQFPARLGRKRRFMPEWDDTAQHREMMQNMGFKLLHHHESYTTDWINLRLDQAILQQGLRKNWRHSLKKFTQSNATIQWDDQGKNLAWMLKQYSIDKAQRGYRGPSISTMIDLSKNMPFLIGRVVKNGDYVAGGLFVLHGAAATYQLGWTSPVGRECAAQHALLWDAVTQLKNRNIHALDLGGIDHDTKESGLSIFKSGMGGQRKTSLPTYC